MSNKDNKSPKRELQKDFESDKREHGLDSLMREIRPANKNRHRAAKADNTHKIVCIIIITYMLIWSLVTL